MKDIFQYKFKFISNDNFSLLFKCYDNKLPITIKLSFYDKEESINLLNYNINNDSLFSYLLSELVLTHKTKHILLPILNIDLKFDDIAHIIKTNNCHEKFYKAILNNEISNICCMQIREQFFKIENLEDFLIKNQCVFKPLLFQVIHTLAIINQEFNNFRHNNLILKNIVIYLKKTNDVSFKYTGFKNDFFYLPNIGYDIKITNFENSSIPNYYNSDYINENSDLVTFINNLNELQINDCDKETKNFLTYILNENNNNYIDLLYNKYFEEYKTNTSTSLSKVFNNEYLLGNKSKKIKSNFNIMTYKSSKNLKRYISIETNIYKNLNRVYNNKNSDIINQSGGYPNVPNQNQTEINESANFKKQKNNPFMTNDERDVFARRSIEDPQQSKDQPLLFEQKIYERQERPIKPNSTIIPIYSDDNFKNNVYGTSTGLTSAITAPINNNYNISLSNPLGDYKILSKVYEDVLPGNVGSASSFTAITLFERINLINYLRNSLLEINDGEEVENNNNISFLSYIKLVEMNPYTTNNKNPYTDLPKNFLLYKAGYPIRLNKKNNQVELSKYSMGINVRIYLMSVGDLKCHLLSKTIDSEDFDLWREIRYYNYIKNEIIKKLISPNFITPVLYKIDSKMNYDWEKISNLKKQSYLNQSLQINSNQKLINNKHNILKKDFLYPKRHNINLTVNLKNNNKIIDKVDLTMPSGKNLVLLTEAPTSNLIQWCRKTYDNKPGKVLRINTIGFHSIEVWKSILFQLIYSFAVLQESEIYISNFSLNYNVYIKDINFDSNSINCWIYRVNSIDYYIPNFGYILLIDSRFNDVELDDSLDLTDPNKMKEFKIYGKIYKNNSIHQKLSRDDMKKLIFTELKKVLNPNNFTRNFKLLECIIPDESIIELIKKIYDDNDINFKDYIYKYFYNFIHNRIGTSLYVTEKNNLIYINNFNYNQGDILSYRERYDDYKWVIFDKNSPVLNQCVVKTVNNKQIEEITINRNTLYFLNDKILQKSENNINYSENILETYIFDNIYN